jgi:hypothetical protein
MHYPIRAWTAGGAAVNGYAIEERRATACDFIVAVEQAGFQVRVRWALRSRGTGAGDGGRLGPWRAKGNDPVPSFHGA